MSILRNGPALFGQRKWTTNWASTGEKCHDVLVPMLTWIAFRQPVSVRGTFVFSMRLHWLLFGVLGLMAPVAADVRNEPCANQIVVAVGWTQADAQHICLAAERALRALHAIDLPLSGGLIVRPLDQQGIRSNGHPLGRYEARTNEIQILPFDAAVRASHERPPAFGVTMTRELWGSYIAHEMAHAAAEPRFSPGTPRITAGEYIAAVLELMVFRTRRGTRFS